ncbi:MAG: response regulator [Spirochaetia bacterium]|nr:response regulator [Spirochaetia bacterium]
MKVMIVDDSTIVRMVIERYLKLTDLEIVAEASNGREAIELFKFHRPDIVTLDITMPEMDGLAALKEMLEINPDAKIIMISALTSKATVVKAVNAGAAAYLIKPLQAHQLTDTLKKVIGG